MKTTTRLLHLADRAVYAARDIESMAASAVIPAGPYARLERAAEELRLAARELHEAVQAAE